jgi:hypothetical protein
MPATGQPPWSFFLKERGNELGPIVPQKPLSRQASASTIGCSLRDVVEARRLELLTLTLPA